MGPDGNLQPNQEGSSGFSRHYGDAAGSPARSLLLFGREDKGAPPATEVSAAAPQRRAAAPEILAEIEATALRYAGHGALRQAGLGVSDWLLLYQANIEVESGYNPQARSPVGAIGLGQLMPATASRLEVDPRDWRQNLDGSARYLLMQLERFGSPELALAAYNAGPEAVTQYGGIPPYEETQGHVRKVLAIAARLRGEIG
ncbi:lytic transglycosylase domain-containing protein [Rubellimicrobium rubrum]|uniref:Lytic transglycosylase domain-containing protein n=2 Tax=Rubellimicrobium rubrum TaxID=2585369 RepID=A0A5C4MNI6_9RHOB|nr:lytic transglycosylase domain-containing protein [Rubellimicrobium rubrum]